MYLDWLKSHQNKIGCRWNCELNCYPSPSSSSLFFHYVSLNSPVLLLYFFLEWIPRRLFIGIAKGKRTIKGITYRGKDFPYPQSSQSWGKVLMAEVQKTLRGLPQFTWFHPFDEHMGRALKILTYEQPGILPLSSFIISLLFFFSCICVSLFFFCCLLFL